MKFPPAAHRVLALLLLTLPCAAAQAESREISRPPPRQSFRIPLDGDLDARRPPFSSEPRQPAWPQSASVILAEDDAVELATLATPISSPPPLPSASPSIEPIGSPTASIPPLSTATPSMAPSPTAIPIRPQPTPAASPTPPPLVPPPNPAPVVALPQAPPLVAVVPAPDPLGLQRVLPIVEVWEAGATSPQIPSRHGSYMDRAYLFETGLVLVRLQFDPLAAGKVVTVTGSSSLILDRPAASLRVQPTGDCTLSLRLQDGINHGYVRFQVDGLTTTLPFSRASALVRARAIASRKENSP